MPKNINKLNSGSIIPELAYTCGVIAAKYEKAQRCPKLSEKNFLPTLKMINSVDIPTIALGKRAANSMLVQACSVKVPKNIKLNACNQMNKGGFSQKGKKLI